MRNAIRSFEAGGSTAEVIEYTSKDKVPYLYTVIFDSDEMCFPVVESFEIVRGEPVELARHKAIESFNSVVKEFLALPH